MEVYRITPPTGEPFLSISPQPGECEPVTISGTIDFGYVRVSSDEQKKKDNSPHAQREKIIAHWDATGFDGRKVVWGFDLGRKRMASLRKRPELVQILSNISKGSRVFISNRDRLGAGELNGHLSYIIRDAGGILESAEGFNGGDAGSVFYRHVQDARAAVELDELSRRVRDTLASRRRKGKTYTSRIYGWSKASTLDGTIVDIIPKTKRKDEDFRYVVNPKEKEVVDWILKKRSQGESLNAIANELNKRKIPAPKGERWYHTSVSSILNTHAKMRDLLSA